MKKKNVLLTALVLGSLMSCNVVWGETVENAYIDSTREFESGSNIIGGKWNNDHDGKVIDVSNKTVNIKITDTVADDETLTITGTTRENVVQVSDSGKLYFDGDKVIVNSNFISKGVAIGITGKNSQFTASNDLEINGKVSGISVANGGTATIKGKLNVYIRNASDGEYDEKKLFGIKLSPSSAVGTKFTVDGESEINVFANQARIDQEVHGIDMSATTGVAEATFNNNTKINVGNGLRAYGLEIGSGNVGKKLLYKTNLTINASGANRANKGILLEQNSGVDINGNLSVLASGGVGGSASGTNDKNSGIEVRGATIAVDGTTNVTVKDHKQQNVGIRIIQSTQVQNPGSIATFGKAESNSTTVVSASGGEEAIGILMNGDSSATFNGLLTIKAKEATYATGLSAERSELNTKGVEIEVNGQENVTGMCIMDESNASVDGDLKITVAGKSENDKKNGLDVQSGNFKGKTANITVNGKDGVAIHASAYDSSIIFTDAVTVNADIAVQAYGSDAKIILEKDFISVADTNSLIYSGNSSESLNINTSKQGTVQFTGNIVAEDELNINLVDEKSYLKLTDPKEKDVCYVWEDDKHYNSITNLTLANSALVDLTADGNKFNTLKLVNLADENSKDSKYGIFKLDIDTTKNTDNSDRIDISDTHSGTHYVELVKKDENADITDAEGTIVASVKEEKGTFLAKDKEKALYWETYKLAKKESDTYTGGADWYLDSIGQIAPPDKPTTTVETVLGSDALNYHTWRNENDKLLQRVGELRHNGEDEKGAWFRVKGSKIGRDGGFGFENEYTAYELGYDELVKNEEGLKRYQGAALSYTDGSSSYSSGGGENHSKSIGFYSTDLYDKGHYLDLVFKISDLDNDFSAFDTNKNRIAGESKNLGVSVSAEYGRKNELEHGWYIEPQAQLTIGYLGGDTYDISNGVTVEQSGITSVLGRVGFNIGRKLGEKGIVYAKANLLHEFGGDYDVTMTSGADRVSMEDSFDDTWFEYGVGVAMQTGKNNHVYFDIERGTGGDFDKDWQWNAGVRWSF